jgi:hypothetical protein
VCEQRITLVGSLKWKLDAVGSVTLEEESDAPTAPSEWIEVRLSPFIIVCLTMPHSDRKSAALPNGVHITHVWELCH